MVRAQFIWIDGRVLRHAVWVLGGMQWCFEIGSGDGASTYLRD